MNNNVYNEFPHLYEVPPMGVYIIPNSSHSRGYRCRYSVLGCRSTLAFNVHG